MSKSLDTRLAFQAVFLNFMREFVVAARESEFDEMFVGRMLTEGRFVRRGKIIRPPSNTRSTGGERSMFLQR